MIALITSPLGRWLGAGVVALLLIGTAYLKGEAAASARCDAAALRDQIKTLQADLAAARRSEDLVQQQQAAAQAREKLLNERIDAYETSMEAAPHLCFLSPGDADSLRKLTSP